MAQIVLDADLRQKLGNLTQVVELVDEQGRVLATVLPSNDPDYHWQLECPHSEEELRRRETSNLPRYSMQQILDHLRNL